MEPQLPAPRPSQEMGPLPQRGESLPNPQSVERPPLAMPERQQENTETRETKGPSQGGGDPAFVARPVQPLQPVSRQPAAPAPSKGGISDDNPMIAGDEDLIEKEWVERAKRIIAETRNDPHRQEREVSKLQADYLKKRYGKEVNLPTDY